ncbi:helix-turn-helix domain-containing protein [Niabella hirudinis]|uniref:helix-turn-helix domain-containing protein n=1 Tax=Niabella hirudinis TaxID=1285929 RepID=UPI003EBD17EC
MKALRKELQLTQRQLSMLIGVSQPLLALYERELRQLPAEASHKLSELQLLLQQASLHKKELRIPPQKAVRDKVDALLKKHQRRANHTALRLGRELEQLQERYNKLLQRLTVIQTLMQKTERATHPEGLLENMEMEALNEMAHCCPEKQALLQYRISLSNAWQQLAREAYTGVREEEE